MESVNNDIHFTMFKGEPGTRKSTQALSYPKPQYWVSYDQKMNALQLPMKLWGIKAKDITFDDYTDWSTCQQKLERFRSEFPYKTLVIDSITSLADMVLRQTVQMKMGGQTKSGNKAGKMIAGISVNEIEDYNAEAAALTDMISLLKDIHKYHKVDVIIIAHVIRTEAKDLTGTVNVSRTIVTAGKKPAAKLPAYCDEVYHFGVGGNIDLSKGGDYEVLTSHVGDDFARTSLPLPTRIVIKDDPMYDRYILPAIKKLKAMETTTLIA